MRICNDSIITLGELMYCGICGNIIPKELEGKRVELIGRGKEIATNKIFSFKITMCSECNEKIDTHLTGGEEKALRRKYEMELYDRMLTPAQVEEELKKFDSKTFGQREEGAIFGG